MFTGLKKMSLPPAMLGCLVFALQLILILAICPEHHWRDAWLNLGVHWDSEWYQAIARWGYINVDGPSHSGLQNANVVFFPGYPYLARGLVLGLHLEPVVALLIVAQGAALGFWCMLFYLLRHLSLQQQLYTALLIGLFPTSWFLDMAYAESLFILSCCFMLYWVTQGQWIRSSFWGIAMTATRLIGLPILAAPFLSTCILKYSYLTSAIRSKDKVWIHQELIRPNVIIALGALGCVSFFLYCAYCFGSWHLYFDMERIHWSGVADPWFLFQLPTWLPPPFSYDIDMAPILPNGWSKILGFDFFRVAAYSFSEILVPLFMWLELFFLYRFIRHRTAVDEKSFIWFLASLLVLLFTCFSLATRHYESMSRCLLPVWVLLVISDALNPNSFFFSHAKSAVFRRIGVGVLLIMSGGFWVELLNRFFLGWWVA
jgi:hypothetical protein